MEEVELEVCQTSVIHEEKVNRVKTELQAKDFSELIVLSKCLGDVSRIQILYALSTYKEMCVCDLAAIVGASMATTSHHLRFLKKNKITKSYKDGKMVYYSLANEEISAAIQSLLKVTEEVQHIFS
ncbi:ArsR/SmtB family transcription factor [Jeotgalibaca caeni]|uniref:ArsR/SmtB family transcription factor n=1 Tax=Jeotgalibaca caeni TaxID=3028623 RepID=UPI00237D4C7F|nr:metalloregulator ArsR/SmtB family transcription factor [Jeotgalibaca caeni]MDE1549611.1 metalloregulator ArsR/SmtB family transcription factor [Jeotgalibaca caeni]